MSAAITSGVVPFDAAGAHGALPYPVRVRIVPSRKTRHFPAPEEAMSVQTALPIEEQTRRSLELSRRWAKAILEHPALLDEIPDGCDLELLPEDDQELATMNIELGMAAIRRGFNVYFRHVRLADLPE
jgi:hypothetical protein